LIWSISGFSDGMDDRHIEMMNLAIKEARAAGQSGEVPVGAVIVDASWQVIARAHNETIGRCDPSAHGEVLALRLAARKTRNYRLLGTTLYATLEPCVMCMGAVVHARVERVVYGAPDPKWGGCGSIVNLAGDSRLNHHPEVIGGVCLERCRELIQAFFRQRR
jgi:tRNA(adenine34) deaminase